MTPGFRELAKLPVPGSGGDIRMRVATRNEDGTGTATGWITVTFEQFARIMNIINEYPQTEDEAIVCKHGNRVWFGHECGLCP